MRLMIDIPEGLKKDFESEQWTALSCMEMKNALMNGTPIQTVTNAEEAEAYPIISKEQQEENCRIVREFLRDVAQAKELPDWEEIQERADMRGGDNE